MKDIKAVLFDLDGTLLDSAPDLVGALNHVRSVEGLAPVAVADYYRFVSHGAAGLLKAGMPEAAEDTFESWRQMFLEYYALNSYRDSRLYDGIQSVLDCLVRAGVPWGIVTNKSEVLTQPVVQAAGFHSSVACVVCGDTLSVSKPDPAPVLHACELIQVQPGNTVFVGDDIRDLQAGISAGTQTAAVHYGYGSHEFATASIRGDYSIRQPRDLFNLLNCS